MDRLDDMIQPGNVPAVALATQASWATCFLLSMLDPLILGDDQRSSILGTVNISGPKPRPYSVTANRLSSHSDLLDSRILHPSI
jgi:hypothetical protein